MGNKVLTQAMQLYEKKNFIEARNLFLSIADTNIIAQYYLGAIYRMGLGIRDDQKEAFKWFLKAAEQGHKESQYLVGCAYAGMYSMMVGETDIVHNDYKRIQSEANLDQSIWQDALPYYHLNGAGVEPNEEKAFEWVMKAANQGYVKAELEIGIYYETGIGVQENVIEAMNWFSKAASKHNTHAIRMLAWLSFEQDKNLEKKVELLQKAVDLGDYRAAFVLGKTYEKESSEEGHFEKACHWYKISADQFDYFESHLKLANFISDCKCEDGDLNQAIIRYRKAIESYKKTHDYGYLGEAYDKLYELYYLGYKDAITTDEIIEYLKDKGDYNVDSTLNSLKPFYEKGYDIGEQYNRAFELLIKAENGDKRAQIEYGYRYIANKMIQDSTKDKAKGWYLKDAENGNLDAQYLISQIYDCESSRKEYLYWLTRAASHGHSRAQYDMSLRYQDNNRSLSIEYLKKASESYIYAQIDLGYKYAHGDSIIKDYKEAYRLYQEAALNLKKIKDIYELRTINYVKFKYNAANDEAEELALNGDVDAQLYMGCLYQYGFEVKRNKNKAIYWYEMAKKQGSDEAQLQLILLNKDLD